MAGRQIPTIRAAPLQHPTFLGLEIQDLDIRLVEIETHRLRREQHGPPAGQKKWPAMGAFAFRSLGDLLRCAARVRHAPQTRR